VADALASGGRQPPEEPRGDRDPAAQLGGLTPPARPDPIPYVAAGLLCALALFYALATNHFQDFFIYRIGAVIGVRGEWPYDVPKVRALVAAQYPDPEPKFDSFVNNNGYFPPPLAVLVYIPFALLPWVPAKVAWAFVTFFAALMVARLPEAFRRPGDPPPESPVWRFVPLALVLNPLAGATVIVGQTTLLFVGCIVAGQWCFDRGRLWLGALLWAVPFIKPHMALPLIPLAWYLGGWRRAAAVFGVVAALNLVGATLVGGSPLAIKDYLDYVPVAHKEVLYNRAKLNPQITSWNRLLYSLTKPPGDQEGGILVELTVVTTAAGYLVWFGLVVGRCAAAGGRPSPAWAVAAAAVGGMLCCQVLGYETLALTLTVPLIRDLFAGGWRWRGTAAVLLLLMQQVPRETFAPLGLDFHRPLGVALFAALILVGPVNPGRAAARRGAGTGEPGA